MKPNVTALLLCLMLLSASLHAQQTPAIIADSLVKAGWVLLEQQNRPADAASNFRQAIATDTNCAKAWSGLGSWYRYSGLPDSAVICFRRTLCIDSLYFNAWLNMGRCYAMMGRKKDALAANRVYEKRYPDSTEWIRGYVYIYPAIPTPCFYLPVSGLHRAIFRKHSKLPTVGFWPTPSLTLFRV